MKALLARILLHLFSWLPLPLNHALGSLLGLVFYWLPTRARKVTLVNLSLCFPELPEARRKELARQSLKETGKSITEVGPFWLWKPRRLLRLIRKVSGVEVFQEAIRREKGVIFLTPHLGAWEITTLYYSGSHPLTCLYRPPRLRKLEPFIKQARERFGVRLVPITSEGIRSIYRALSLGETVGILPDPDPGRNAGVQAPFFGVNANTMSLVGRIARKTGACVLFVFAERLPGGAGYHLHFLESPGDIAQEDPHAAATALNRGIEQCVRMKPEQYQWSYKRFKTRPAGEDDLYK